MILKILTKSTYKLADKIVVVSQGIKDDLEKQISIDSSKVDVIYNPIDINRIQKLGLDEYTINKSSPVFVGMGRLVAQKRFDILIKAFSIVKKKISTASLYSHLLIIHFLLFVNVIFFYHQTLKVLEIL